MPGRPLLMAMAMALGLASTTAEARPKTSTHWSKIAESQGFTGWRAQFQHMVDGGLHPVNHMCVVVATYTQPSIHDITVWGYLYWRENHELYTLSQSKDTMSDLSIWQSPLNLWTDVVKDQKDIGSSTFIETRGWVDNILHHCDTNGTRLILKKSNG